MNSIEQYFQALSSLAMHRNHRFAITVKGDADWQQSIVQLATAAFAGQIFQLGGEAQTGVERYLTYNKGQQFLGQECRLLLIDLRDGFDANSLTSALGTVRGGGLVLFLLNQRVCDDLSYAWLARACSQFTCIEQHKPLPVIPIEEILLSPETSITDALNQTEQQIFDTHRLGLKNLVQQDEAIERIIKVVSGHRRRPLVLTADRGRGKTSALGIAAARLIQDRFTQNKAMRILVTSPVIKNLAPLFEHAQRLLPEALRTKLALTWHNSVIEFIAPDELLRCKPSCDLLLVDEAAAIPLPLLFSIVEHYHRVVFSTTIHGYEGCGRGFTLKFQTWLRQHRPGAHFYHMDMPIRWAAQDPLEQWQYKTFLLDAELNEVDSVSDSNSRVQLYDQQALFSSPSLLRECFALLVNAHYQTTPNDLMLLLSDSSMKLWARFEGEVCIGCIIGVEEGGLSAELVAQIRQGKRRPKGHLIATTLANHLGLDIAAQVPSLRIMRIAVHPAWQSRGIGSLMLTELQNNRDYQFCSTSYGVTDSLLHFWLSNGYVAVKLGSQRDQASGCHSLAMVKGAAEWIAQAESLFNSSFVYQLKDAFKEIEPSLVASLLLQSKTNDSCQQSEEVSRLKFALIESYIAGGTNYENVAPFIEQALLTQGMKVDSALLIRKVIQQWGWEACAQEFGLVGRKQIEQALRDELQRWVSKL
ncbi:GNAT family N-acetyltransferase [Vibrio scophthalmi]|uniref:tRNA(Met) cytidine acetyltransferase TmcA n=1 Tax=Vibrio scophthalmi TaxID=45658 RepID=UPI0038734FD9